MDYKNSDLPWCANCKNGETEKDGDNVYCTKIEIYRMEDDFCGLHEWKELY